MTTHNHWGLPRHVLRVCTSKSKAALGTDGAGPWLSTWLSGGLLHPPEEAVPATPGYPTSSVL